MCRYLQFADSVLAEILLTADRMTRLVKKAETSEQLEELMPDRTIIIDCTEAVPRQRLQDRDARKNTYSVTDRVYEVACVKHIKITDFTSNLGTALQKLELLPYSGKKKRFTINTAITTNKAGPDTCSRHVL